MHWDAGSHEVSQSSREHYHEIVAGDGERVLGVLRPEANENTSDGQYVPHTRALNTGSIGLAMAAMRGAMERPFSPGSHPITPVQLEVFCEMVAEYAVTYGIPNTRRTILTHAEVQPTLGIWQRGKWDITWLPGLSRPIDPVEAGDRLRAMIGKHMTQAYRPSPPVALPKPKRPGFRWFWVRP